MTERHTEWIKARVERGTLPADCIVVNERFAQRFTSKHQRVFNAVACSTSRGDETFTAELPGVQTPLLQSDGLILVGSTVHEGDVLVGMVKPSEDAIRSPEEKLLGAIFGDSVPDMKDVSLRVPPYVEGVVLEACMEPDRCARGELMRARVVLGWERPLAVGDILQSEDGRCAVVCALRRLEGDVQWNVPDPTVALAKISMVRDVVHARSIGPYSLVTQQPLGGREQFGGQHLSSAQARALLKAGARWTAWELLTVKSGSVLGRTRCYEGIVTGRDENIYTATHPRAGTPSSAESIFDFLQPDPAGGQSGRQVLACTPEAVSVLHSELLATCFSIPLERRRLRAKLLDASAVRRLSHGEVKTPETLHYKTLEPQVGGLFCERIFGPIQDYECRCGRVKRMKHRGETCSHCGVECTGSAVRRQRFGHVELCTPVLHPWFLNSTVIGREA